jgi:hypothetical protein
VEQSHVGQYWEFAQAPYSRCGRRPDTFEVSLVLALQEQPVAADLGLARQAGQ